MKKYVSFLPKKRSVKYFLLIPALLFFASSVFAQTMQSATYKIISDSINVGGDDTSSSTNYKLGDTLGEVGTGDSNSASYYMHAGFWQMQASYISISSPSDLVLTNIGGIAGEGSEGTLSWTVVTDNVAGYSMTIAASTSPALQSAEDSFSDYVPAGSDPDYDFVIAPSSSEFGFTPEGTDVSSRFKDNGSACNTGAGETSGKCWDGLSTTPQTVAGKTSANHPSGSTITVRFRAEAGNARIQTSGSYSASVTATAITL